jgi:hypothetical protein
LHHVNGDRDDNRVANLLILCPNCHAQAGAGTIAATTGLVVC